METSGLYNAPMHTATKLNRDLLTRYIAEGQIEALLSLFEVQFDALRRAEALQMLHIQEIRTLKHRLASLGKDDNNASELQATPRSQQHRAMNRLLARTSPEPKPAKRNPISEIEL